MKKYQFFDEGTVAGRTWMNPPPPLNGDVAEFYLASDVEALIADAERYRWLKSINRLGQWQVQQWQEIDTYDEHSKGFETIQGDRLDAEIDGAMQRPCDCGGSGVPGWTHAQNCPVQRPSDDLPGVCTIRVGERVTVDSAQGVLEAWLSSEYALVRLDAGLLQVAFHRLKRAAVRERAAPPADDREKGLQLWGLISDAEARAIEESAAQRPSNEQFSYLEWRTREVMNKFALVLVNPDGSEYVLAYSDRVAEVRDSTRAAHEPCDEPVAWMYESKNGADLLRRPFSEVELRLAAIVSPDMTTTPLYKRPAPPPADDLYALLVRRGYAQHEAHAIAFGEKLAVLSSPPPLPRSFDIRDSNGHMTRVRTHGFLTAADAQRHERRVVGHASGWKEHMDECVCGQKQWPCPSVTKSDAQ
jgi:hypothetical protein